MDLHLTNKNALVCASSSGLGLAIAKNLAREGANVFLCARDEAKLMKATEIVSQVATASVKSRACDLAQTSQLEELVEEVQAGLGSLDILVNNVGGPPPSSAKETSLEQWEAGFRQLFLSSTRLSQLAVPQMITNGFGRIVTITSLSVLEPIDNLAVSTTMRAAVTAFNKCLAKEVADKGVTVNSIMPGVIHTDRVEFLRTKKAEREGTSLQAEMQKTRDQIPMKRLGTPEEFADLVLFLASSRASYITGENFSVDGGLRKSYF